MMKLNMTRYFLIAMLAVVACPLQMEAKKKDAKGFASIIGDIDPEIKVLAEYLMYPEVRELFETAGIEPPSGYLLTGRPGTGKTKLMRCLAQETDIPYIDLSADEVSSSPKAVHNLFALARQEAKKSDAGFCFIFIDEFESLAARKKSTTGSDTKAAIRAMLSEMDGFDDTDKSIIVFGSTNYPQDIDEALLRQGRFDRTIEAKLPNVTTRKKLLEYYADGVKIGKDVNWHIIAENTNNFSPADIKGLINRAGILALLEAAKDGPVRNVNANKLCVSRKHIIAAIRATYLELARQGADIELEIELDRLDVVFGGKKEHRGFKRIAGGVDPVIKNLVDMINGTYDYEKFKVPFSKGILLYGPPGTGKTALVRALAEEAGVEFINARADSLMTMYVGSGPEAIKQLFARAREKAKGNRFGKCILFFDEIHALGSQANGYVSVEMTKTITALLQEMDGLYADSSVIVIAATNFPSRIDPAMMREGRFTKRVAIEQPDHTKRMAILQLYCDERPMDKKVSIKDLADKTDGKSAAYLRALVELAAEKAMINRAKCIQTTHFEAALAELNAPHMPEKKILLKVD